MKVCSFACAQETIRIIDKKEKMIFILSLCKVQVLTPVLYLSYINGYTFLTKGLFSLVAGRFGVIVIRRHASLHLWLLIFYLADRTMKSIHIK